MNKPLRLLEPLLSLLLDSSKQLVSWKMSRMSGQVRWQWLSNVDRTLMYLRFPRYNTKQDKEVEASLVMIASLYLR